MKLPFLMFCIMLSVCVSAQLVDFDNEEIERDFLYNINLYAQQYAGSVVDAYGVNQATAWQFSGKTLRPLGFSIALQSSATFLKESDQQFNFNQTGFSDKLRLANPNAPNLPTVIGGATEKDLIYQVEGELTTPFGGTVQYEEDFSALNGIKTPYNALPKTALLFSMGLPANFEVSLRYFPNVEVRDVNHYEYGFGLKHQLNKYFLEEESPIYVSASVLYNYSRFDYKPQDLLEGENQNVILEDQTVNAELTASYEKEYYSVFGLVSYYTTNTAFNINGTYRYEVEEQDSFGNTVVQEAFSVTNPVNLSSTQGLMRAAIGASAKYKEIAVLALAYNFSKYHSLSFNLVFKINNQEKE